MVCIRFKYFVYAHVMKRFLQPFNLIPSRYKWAAIHNQCLKLFRFFCFTLKSRTSEGLSFLRKLIYCVRAINTKCVCWELTLQLQLSVSITLFFIFRFKKSEIKYETWGASQPCNHSFGLWPTWLRTIDCILLYLCKFLFWMI